MGVSINVYGFFGVRLNWNDQLNDAFEEFWNDNREQDLPDYAFDSMTGDYQVLGVRLFDSGDFRYGAEDGDGCTKLDLESLADQEQKYKDDFINKFPQFAEIMEEPFKILMFTHYS